MATKRVIELDERTTLDTGDFLLVDAQTGTRKLAFTTLLNYLTLSSIVFVTELPTTDIQTNVIYFVPHSGSLTLWDEYVYRDDVWVHIAQSTIDLSSIYQTKTDNSLNTTSKQIVGAINEVNNELTDVVDNLSIKTESGTKVIQAGGYILPTNVDTNDVIVSASLVFSGSTVVAIPSVINGVLRLYGVWTDTFAPISNIAGDNINYSIKYLDIN